MTREFNVVPPQAAATQPGLVHQGRNDKYSLYTRETDKLMLSE
jgi:hypothetical protein